MVNMPIVSWDKHRFYKESGTVIPATSELKSNINNNNNNDIETMIEEKIFHL